MIKPFKNRKVPFFFIKESTTEKENCIQTFEHEYKLKIPPDHRNLLLSLNCSQLVETLKTIQSAYYWQERTRLLEAENQRLRELLNEN